jgi:hypothetical protein
MPSGRPTDVLQSLLDWLSKAEAYLVEDQPVFGDLDTVNVLVEKHKVWMAGLLCWRYVESRVFAMQGEVDGKLFILTTNLMSCVL